MFIPLVLIGLIACKKDPPPDNTGAYDSGMIVLNEGLFQQNNASLSFYSPTENKSYQQVFLAENQRGLGDTANDFEKYTLNGKEYIIIAVDVSSQIEIVDANTLVSVAQIPVFNGAIGREPRRVKVYSDKAFTCNYDGTVSVLDLNTNTIVQTIMVGDNPDGLTTIGNKLYVSNSGGLNYPVYDSTITIINMDDNSIIGTIETRINSSQMLVDNQGDIYLLSTGNYSDIQPALLRIDSQSNQVVQTFNLPITAMAMNGDWLYYYQSTDKSIRRINTLDETLEATVFIDCSTYETFYKMIIDAETGNIYGVDAKGYVNSSVISAYNSAGLYQYEFTAGINANDIIFN